MSTANLETMDMPSLREEQVRLTQQRILDTFESELLDRGYDETSIRSVAKRAGISVPTVYRHFPNKEALLVALLEATTYEHGFNLFSELEDVSDPMQTLTNLLDRMWTLNEARPGRTKAMLNAVAAPSDGESSQIIMEILKKYAFIARESLLSLDYLPRKEIRKLEGLVALLIGRATWERLRFGHGLPLDIARAAVLDTIQATLDATLARFPGPEVSGHSQKCVRTAAQVEERYRKASKEL